MTKNEFAIKANKHYQAINSEKRLREEKSHHKEKASTSFEKIKIL